MYYINREYYVACQDLVSSSLRGIDMAIDVRTHKLGSHKSITSEQGGPAETWVSLNVHMQTQRNHDSLSPVVIRIRTGRKHQIRTHLRSSGHPSVVDGMYGVWTVVMTDLAPSEVGFLRAVSLGEAPDLNCFEIGSR